MTPARFAVRSLAWAAAPWLLAGCTMGPNFQRPAPWWSPARFTAPAAPAVASQTVATPIDPHWWTLLGDPLLTSLEGRLDAGNLDLRVATLRLAEARAQLGVSRAALYPGVNGNASYLRQEASRKGVLALATAGTPGTGANGTGGRGATPNTSLFKPYDLYQAGFDASWEVDLWGRVARSVESARAQVSASADSRRDTMVTASAELARDYVDLRGAQRKLDITRQNLDIAKQNLQLTQARAAGGITTDLDVANAAAEMQTVAAQIPLLEARAASLMNAIAFLLGAPPHALEGELATSRAVPPVPPLVPVGVPSDLLRRRPDIRRAEAQLHAATADIGVAVADFYPRFVLAGSGSLQSVQFHSLGDWAATAFSFGPSVSLPIFEGGRLTRTLELRKAQQQEAAITYQRTVLAALHEVDDALTAYRTEQQRRARLEAAVVQNRRALALARDRYAQGVADFLQVLTVQRALLAAEQDLADSTTAVSTDLVALYKALGGGWNEAAPVAAPGPAKA